MKSRILTTMIACSTSIFVHGRMPTVASLPTLSYPLLITKQQHSAMLLHHQHPTRKVRQISVESHITKDINDVYKRNRIQYNRLLVQQNNVRTLYGGDGTTTQSYYSVRHNSIYPSKQKDKNEPQPPNYQHFVFGYGSLMCPTSRAMTAPDQAYKIATPVIVKGIERIWSKRTVRGMTAMGIRWKQQATCIGVLLPANDIELQQFDEREVGYHRKQIPLDHIDIVPFLSVEEYYSHPHQKIFLYAKQQQYQEDTVVINEVNGTSIPKPNFSVCVWAYIPNELHPPNHEYPIAQSYVDTILRGCFSINEAFAREFIATTKGWHPNEFNDHHDANSQIMPDNVLDVEAVDDMSNSKDTATTKTNPSGSFWVDDRNDPIYPRGDQIWSIHHALKIDNLLLQYRPKLFFDRRKRQKQIS